MITTPVLEIDKLIHPNGLPARLKVERRIVFALIEHLQNVGFEIDSVDDGYDDISVHNNAGDAMELIFNLDYANLYFKNKQGNFHYVSLSMGEGTDMISDWSYSHDDADGFGAAMDKFDTEDYA
jgi:hypothetical protein